jgi:hypothetical protein
MRREWKRSCAARGLRVLPIGDERLRMVSAPASACANVAATRVGRVPSRCSTAVPASLCAASEDGLGRSIRHRRLGGRAIAAASSSSSASEGVVVVGAAACASASTTARCRHVGGCLVGALRTCVGVVLPREGAATI